MDATCPASCVEGSTDYFRLVTPEYLRAVAPCIASVACADDAWARCYQDTAPQLTISSSAANFCKAMGATWFNCNYQMDLEACAAGYSPWSESALSRTAVACAGTACDSLQECLSNAAEGENR